MISCKTDNKGNWHFHTSFDKTILILVIYNGGMSHGKGSDFSCGI